MGDLDDAIREHLELKRRRGASDEEITLKEREAQRQGALPSDAGAAPGGEATEASADLVEPEGPEEVVVTPAEPPPVSLPDELEPDEVLPEEALEPEGLPEAPPEEARGPLPDWSPGDLPEDQREQSEDVLEATPEFLEDMPEQDRLWFEQRPPKDFDFGD